MRQPSGALGGDAVFGLITGTDGNTVTSKWTASVFMYCMDIDEQPSETQPPFGAAYLAGLASLVFVYFVSKDVIARLQVWWAELLVYALISVPVIFVILYRSNWHREWTGAVRTLSLIGISCVVFGSVLLSLGVLAIVGFAFVLGLHHDVGPG